MQAGKVATKIRLRVGDMQKTRFSDYEILSALNDAMSMLWVALAEKWITSAECPASFFHRDCYG